jgi:hypothetical protein
MKKKKERKDPLPAFPQASSKVLTDAVGASLGHDTRAKEKTNVEWPTI